MVVDFKLGESRYRDLIEVRPVAGVLTKQNISLIKGREKSFDLSLFALPTAANLHLEFNKGKALSNGSQISLIAEESGAGILTIWASMPYGKIRISQLGVDVLDEQKPMIRLGAYDNGSLVPKEDLINIHSAHLINENQAKLYSFQLTIINPTLGTSSSSLFNKGASLNSSLKNALLNKADKGSIILINGIKVAQDGQLRDGEVYTIQVI